MTLLRNAWDGFRYVLGLTKMSRRIPVYPDDTLLVSYPRSGNNLARFLLANLTEPGAAVSFANIDRKVPFVYNHTRRSLSKIPRPRLLATHEYFDPRYPKVIYIVRDPRDVVVSLYHLNLRQQLIEDGYPWERYVPRFLRGDLPDWGPWTWADHLVSWVAARGNSSTFFFVRYEDLQADTAGTLKRLSEFLAMERTPEELAQVAQASSADKMRAFEKEAGDAWPSGRKLRKEIPFVRSAKTGGWRRFLSEELAAQIEIAWAPLLQQLGYEIVTTEGRNALSRKTLVSLDLSALVRQSKGSIEEQASRIAHTERAEV